MSVAKAMTRFCGAKTRSGGACKRPAGEGTDHLGAGRCRFHTGSTPNGRKHAAREAAQEFVAAHVAEALPADPLDTLVLSVHLANGAVAFHRSKIAEGEASSAMVEAYDRALDRLSRFSKAAVDAGIADRLASAAERYGEQIALVAEAGLAALVKAGVELSNAHRAAFARAVEAAVSASESEVVGPAPIKALPPGRGS
jgi:hypothetical protein